MQDLPGIRRRHGQRGFSLVEVLVSIVVLSFGLLGIVGLQAGALQSNHDARQQSAAVVLARELAEMMRGNKDVAMRTANNPYLGSFRTSPLAPSAPSFCLGVAATSPCADAAAVATAQMTEWLARADAQLPGARVDVCFDGAPYDADGLPRWSCDDTGDMVVIKIGWTRRSTDRSLSGDAALERAAVPSIVFPVTPGGS